jgi:hypothetical protein
MASETPESGDNSDSTLPIAATLIDEQGVRRGSPFAASKQIPQDTAAESQALDGKAQLDSAAELDPLADFAGVGTETAKGGVWASILLVPMAAVSTWWFPLGGILISGLGGGLGMMGIASQRPLRAMIFMLVHVLLFCTAYWRFL